MPLTQFFTIDECHFYPNESPRYGYVPIGQRVISPAPDSKRGGLFFDYIWVKSKKAQGMVHCKLTNEPINTKFFHDFLDRVKFFQAPDDKRKELSLLSVEK